MLKGDRARDEGHNRAAHPTHCANLPSTPRERITGGTCDTSSQFASFLWYQAGDLSDENHHAAYSDFPHPVDQRIDEKDARLVARDARDESVRLLAQLDDETLEWREIGRIPG